jgi:hypothetical protein
MYSFLKTERTVLMFPRYTYKVSIKAIFPCNFSFYAAFVSIQICISNLNIIKMGTLPLEIRTLDGRNSCVLSDYDNLKN